MPEAQRALSPLELVEDVILLAIKEALCSIPEEQSSTLKIEGVLGDLEPEIETVEVREAEEEEGSSSTLEKDDNEGKDDDYEDQVENSPEEHFKQHAMIQTGEQTPAKRRNVPA